MNPQEVREIIEAVERARDRKDRPIALTIAITAAFLAMSTMFSHRTHTEETIAAAKVVEDWGYYHSKHDRAHDYGRDAELAVALDKKDLALRDYQKSIEEQCGKYPPSPSPTPCTSPVNNPALLQALPDISTLKVSQNDPGKSMQQLDTNLDGQFKGAIQLLKQARDRERDQQVIRYQASIFDISELLLEFSIVLCSVSLLVKSKVYRKGALLVTSLGVIVLASGVLLLLFPRFLSHWV